MNKSKVVVADTKESFIQAVEKALSQGYLPTEEYVVKDGYYVGKFSLDEESVEASSTISKEAAMKAIEQPIISVVRNTRKRKA